MQKSWTKYRKRGTSIFKPLYRTLPWKDIYTSSSLYFLDEKKHVYPDFTWEKLDKVEALKKDAGPLGESDKTGEEVHPDNSI